MGVRVFLCDSRERNERDDTGIYYIANQFKKDGEGESNFKVEEDEFQS
ncbi:MAG: hypothetical protein LBC27_03195 [Spirochaetaceae bacterium]|jgi:hypothetical protein|nr:hypothetical protein [Spirochaetaceae bacterium]